MTYELKPTEHRRDVAAWNGETRGWPAIIGPRPAVEEQLLRAQVRETWEAGAITREWRLERQQDGTVVAHVRATRPGSIEGFATNKHRRRVAAMVAGLLFAGALVGTGVWVIALVVSAWKAILAGLVIMLIVFVIGKAMGGHSLACSGLHCDGCRG